MFKHKTKKAFGKRQGIPDVIYVVKDPPKKSPKEIIKTGDFDPTSVAVGAAITAGVGGLTIAAVKLKPIKKTRARAIFKKIYPEITLSDDFDGKISNDVLINRLRDYKLVFDNKGMKDPDIFGEVCRLIFKRIIKDGILNTDYAYGEFAADWATLISGEYQRQRNNMEEARIMLYGDAQLGVQDTQVLPIEQLEQCDGECENCRIDGCTERDAEYVNTFSEDSDNEDSENDNDEVISDSNPQDDEKQVWEQIDESDDGKYGGKGKGKKNHRK